MKKLFLKKLKSQLGETLVETLFAILIATFASILLAGATSTAIELNRQARERDAINQLCLEKLATEADVVTTDGEDVHVIIQPMQMDNDTGKLVKKTDGDTEVAAKTLLVEYTGCAIDEEGTLGDFSTYKLKLASAGS